MPVIIGVAGFKGAGKSEVRKYLVSRYGFTAIAMADPLKSMLRALGLNDEQLNGSLKETPCNQLQGQTPRHAMQTLGTEWGRMMIADNLWIEAWRAKVLSCPTPVVVDDVRFENEFNLVRSMGGKLLRVTRPGANGSGHISETQGADLEVDYGITNRAKISDLHKLIDKAIVLFRFRKQA